MKRGWIVVLVVCLLGGAWWFQVYRRTHAPMDVPPSPPPEGAKKPVPPTGGGLLPNPDLPPETPPGKIILTPEERAVALPTSAAIKTLLGETGDPSDYRLRSEALNKLTRRLTPADVEALRLFFDFHYDNHPEIPIQKYNALKNDALDILLRQDRLPEGLGEQLSAMYADETHDPIWRDYCLQYLAVYAKRRWDGVGEGDPEHEKMRQTYFDALSQGDASFAGTALIGLESLRDENGFAKDDEVRQAALALVRSNSTCEASRITALRLCGKLGVSDALETARMLAQAGETSMLRAAAAATLADIGGPSERALLEGLKASASDKDLRFLDAALKRLAQKTAQAAGKGADDAP